MYEFAMYFERNKHFDFDWFESTGVVIQRYTARIRLIEITYSFIFMDKQGAD